MEIEVDIGGPEVLDRNATARPPGKWWLGVAPHLPNEEDPFGIARLVVFAPARTRWGALVTRHGYLRYFNTEEHPSRSALRQGQTMLLTVESQGIPMLRAAHLLPYRPLSTVDEATGEERYPNRRALERRGVFSDTVRSIVAGPGVPAHLVTLARVREQVTLACTERLLSTAQCTALTTALAASGEPTRTQAAAALALLTNAPARDPLLMVTVIPQLQLLSTGRLPTDAWGTAP